MTGKKAKSGSRKSVKAVSAAAKVSNSEKREGLFTLNFLLFTFLLQVARNPFANREKLNPKQKTTTQMQKDRRARSPMLIRTKSKS